MLPFLAPCVVSRAQDSLKNCESYGKQFVFDPKTPKNTDFMQETDIADPFKGIGQAS